MTREEAIDIVRSIYKTDKEKEALVVLIPELAEIESERIRKFLVRLCKRCSENSTDFMGDIKKADVLAWLEKQKEQKLLPGFDDLTPDEKMNHPLYLEGFDVGREVGRVEAEQKPADLPPGFYFIDLDGKKYYSKEFRFGDMKMKIVEDKSEKPAERSEEDEK